MRNLSIIVISLSISLLVGCMPETKKKCKENQVLVNGSCVLKEQSVVSLPTPAVLPTLAPTPVATIKPTPIPTPVATIKPTPIPTPVATIKPTPTPTPIATLQPKLSCGEVPHNGTQSRVAYSQASVPYGQSCTSIQQTQTRTCNNGNWSAWSGSYPYLSCSVQTAQACGNIASGAYEVRTMYQTANVSEGNNCVSQIQNRLCTNGQFGSWSGTYTQPSCSISRIRYEQATVSVAGGCHPETQRMTCEAGVCGVWTPNSYTHTSCLVVTGNGCTQVTFSWSPNTENILLGYKIHQGISSMTFTKHHDVGLPNTVNNQVQATVTDDFESGKTYYFAATAYGQGNVESDYSTQVSWTCTEN